MKNTTMGTVPGTTAGAGASAPAPDGLTKDRCGVEIYLSRANHVSRALAYFEKAKAKEKGSTWGHYYEAVILLRDRWNNLVEDVVREGGLLHLGRVY